MPCSLLRISPSKSRICKMTRFICYENRQEEESASPVPGIGLDVLSSLQANYFLWKLDSTRWGQNVKQATEDNQADKGNILSSSNNFSPCPKKTSCQEVTVPFTLQYLFQFLPCPSSYRDSMTFQLNSLPGLHEVMASSCSLPRGQ
jgi:hypothetical protein